MATKARPTTPIKWHGPDEFMCRAIPGFPNHGEKLAPLAAEFGVSATMISYIARRKSWQHIPEVTA